jgi:serine protease Do
MITRSISVEPSMPLSKLLMLPLLLLVSISVTVLAETVKDRAGAVRGDRATFENDLRWNYNDVQKGFNEARRTGKPLLVVLRCVPCMACAGIDASVLNEPELRPLLDQFVCVRVINANALDLSLLQFDYDLSFSTLFFNPDGTIYGRFGSWSHQKNALDKSTAGYKRALESVLALHQGFPANKAALAPKQPGPIPFKDPLEIPGLAGKYSRQLDWEKNPVQSCVHCHQVGDAIRAHYRAQKQPIPSQWIYPMPAPETVGLTLAHDHVGRVSAVMAGSAADKAGFAVGDDIRSIEGAPLVAVADVSWALHRAPENGSLSVVVERNGRERSLKLALVPGWRSNADIARRVGTWPMRAMALGGMVLQDLRDEERAERRIPTNSMALLVKHVGEYNEHAAAKKAGFRKDDVLVAIDGRTERITESRLIGEMLQTRKAGDRIKATMLRGTNVMSLAIPVQ